jgi:hypothetical protein
MRNFDKATWIFMLSAAAAQLGFRFGREPIIQCAVNTVGTSTLVLCNERAAAFETWTL